MNESREKFSSGLAVFLAALSSAIGLGNIWMFPYVTGENGGAAFIIIYLICILILGLPALISEFLIGRKTRKNVFGAVSIITDKKFFKSIGGIAITATYCMLFFYTVVAGWVYSYIFKAATGSFKGMDAQAAAEMFNKTSLGPVAPIVWQLIAVAVAAIILATGIKSGIEKLTKVLMPILVLLLIICVIRSLTLPNSMVGVKFLLMPDFSKVNFEVVLAALGLAFFKMSIGSGAMMTYGSYFTEDNNLISTAGKVALGDTIVSILAGLAIFPAVFSYGLEPSSGPGLLFNTVPLIFSQMLGGGILAFAFFLLTGIAATMAMLSMLQVLAAVFTEELGIERKKALIINSLIIVGIGSLAALSVNPEGALAHVKIFGLTIYSTFDTLVSKVLLPLNGLLIVLLVGHFIKDDSVVKQLTNEGTLKNQKLVKILLFIIKYITPALIIIVFVKTILGK